jgi:hypothetical protein
VTLVPASSRGSGGGGSGTVTSVGSADSSVTVTNPTTTPDLSVSYSHISGAPAFLVPTAVKNANYNAAAADLVRCDISAGSFTVTLPTAPANNTQVCVEVVTRVTALASNQLIPTYVTIATGGSDVFFRPSGPTSGIFGRGSIVLQYSASDATWTAPGVGDFLPIGWTFGYDQIVAPITVSSTTPSSGTSVIACPAHVFDGGAVIAEFYSPDVQPVAAGNCILRLFEGVTEIGDIAVVVNASGGAPRVPVKTGLRFPTNPSAGSHTYTVTATQGGGNATVDAGAGGTTTSVPAYVRFTKE